MLRFRSLAVALALLVCAPALSQPADAQTLTYAGNAKVLKTVVFTAAGANSYTVPADVTQLLNVRLVGGGGSGGCGHATGGAGGGGAGGVIAGPFSVPVTAGATLTITIGAGGTACTVGNDGNIGGATSISGTDATLPLGFAGGGGSAGLAANGGAGGNSGTGTPASSNGGAGGATGAGSAISGGVAQGPFLTGNGGSGGAGTGSGGGGSNRCYTGSTVLGGTNIGGGAGGASFYGCGGAGGTTAVAGSAPAAIAWGAGGGGGGQNAIGGIGRGGYVEFQVWTSF